MTSEKSVAYWVVDALVQIGVQSMICSPGSRNAPLIIAADAHPGISIRTVLDERSASFQALGEALVSNTAVAICCTSGSAIANYHPAILEAFYSKVPVVVLTADRPLERIGKGEGQTVVQPNFFEPEIGASIHLNDSDSKEMVAQQLGGALNQALHKSEPIHINISFNEPLYGHMEGHEPIEVRLEAGHATKEIFKLGSKPTALICGQLRPEQTQHILQQGWLDNTSGTWFVDPLSGLLQHPNARHINEILHELPPQILSIGGQIMDKRPKFHLRALDIEKHIHIDPYQHWDISDAQEFTTIRRQLDFNLDLAPNTFITSAILKAPHQGVLPWSDARVIQILTEYLTESDLLHIGNSSAPRYFGFLCARASMFSNRGTAGIEGSLSTAVGAALALPARRHFCLVGDQSFLYDSNALMTQNLPSNLVIVVMNNRVGGIFDWLPGTKEVSPSAKAVFAHEQSVNLKALCSAVGLPHSSVHSSEELSKALKNNTSTSILIEAITAQSANLAAYKQLGTAYL